MMLHRIAIAPAALLYVGVLLAVRHPRAAKITGASLLGLGLAAVLARCFA
ncbi:MAG: hypothetical protein KF764_24840 [Labilithrix sp.]|nr:hypothetical protein [Labilithrix sp.]MBX3220473.1 hypothetical protein [Labilithrix sp.]